MAETGKNELNSHHGGLIVSHVSLCFFEDQSLNRVEVS